MAVHACAGRQSADINYFVHCGAIFWHCSAASLGEQPVLYTRAGRSKKVIGHAVVCVRSGRLTVASSLI